MMQKPAGTIPTQALEAHHPSRPRMYYRICHNMNMEVSALCATGVHTLNEVCVHHVEKRRYFTEL